MHRIELGRVGRAHGLDGSFYVTRPRNQQVLEVGATVDVAGNSFVIARRAGTNASPIVRFASITSREDAERMRGETLHADVVPPELGKDEYWEQDLVGRAVVDGDVVVGEVARMLVLPSCEVLEVTRPGGAKNLLVPMVRDAIRRVDVANSRIEVNLGFLGEADLHGQAAEDSNEH